LLSSTACSGPDADLPPPYARLPVPEARLRSPEARARGRELFLANCALCHGQRADGRGRRAAGFARPPASFSDPTWRARTSPRRAYFAIREGLHGTPMPSWRALGEEECWDLVAYVLAVADGARTSPGR
jgi:mono/diheme cytochrome c family protein